MGLEEILDDLLSKSHQHSHAALDGNTTTPPPSFDLPNSVARTNTNSLQQQRQNTDPTCALIATFETECNNRYRDPGPGLHFVGILLAVLAAEVVSAYWAGNERATTFSTMQNTNSQSGTDKRGPPNLLSCFYSTSAVAFVLSHPTENHIHSRDVVVRRWRDHPQTTSSNTDELDEQHSIFTVSAAVRLPRDNGAGNLRDMPLFSCPRKYVDLIRNPDAEVEYINERFEENDLLPPRSMALAARSVEQSLESILRSHSPRDTAMPIDESYVERTSPKCLYLIVDDFFFKQQFARGLGVQVNWITDPAFIRNAKLELNTNQDLVSAKVIGLLGSAVQPDILYLRRQKIGFYTSVTKAYSTLSYNADFFEAGVEYSSFDLSQFNAPVDPLMDIDTPQLIPVDQVPPQNLSSILKLPPNVNLFDFNRQALETPAVEGPKDDTRGSPSFFSPSFADHLSNSNYNRPDPRIHTANIPLRLTTPTRSQTYPSTPSPMRSGPVPPLNYSMMSRSQASSRQSRRPSDTPLPHITPITPAELGTLFDKQTVLVIDIRAFAAFSKGRLVNSINVCIPTVLLKRTSLSLDDISDGIVSKDDRGRFAKWKDADGILIYDADSLRVKDAYPIATLAAKFAEEGFDRITYGLTGGFAALGDTPSLIDTAPLSNLESSPSPPTGSRFPSPMTAKQVGVNAAKRLTLECKESPLFSRDNPTQVPGAPAFWSNIRQNMDLHGGVGPVIPINAPAVPDSVKERLPKWLRDVAYGDEGPNVLARHWESIEVAEKRRLEGVLTGKGMQGRFSISAAMERGEKNRYTNIWPFEWNRVKVPHLLGSLDYFNGSFIYEVIPGVSGRRYIATQAPLPGTFEDFWRVIWGEDVNVIVSLTAMEEGGQIKCHPFWRQGIHGHMEVTPVSSTEVGLGSDQKAVIRTLMLRNLSEPFASIREIVQVHFSGWPDFGTPAEPASIVSLVKVINEIASQRGKIVNAPLLVHCSAGCGRTGTFCTVDSVMQYLDSNGSAGDEDLIYRSVLGLREQRMSLVQTLRQYVLCYECVLYHLLENIAPQDSQIDVE